MNCTLTVKEVSARGRLITGLLKPLLGTGQTLACWPRLVDRQTVLAPYLGVDRAHNPGESRFNTRIPTIRASYHERWNATDESANILALERAYLHLFLRTSQREEKEIVALHCDPNEALAAPHYRYKAAPHIHMSTAEDPMPHCHICLNNSNYEDVLSSVDQLTKALHLAITMINDQVLGVFDPRTRSRFNN